MTTIGESLRRERLRRNLQLEQVSKELKISSRMLAAIEAEDFEKLPGGVFTKSFVRQYAHLLGLDEEEMAGEVDRLLRPDAPADGPRPIGDAVPLPRMEAWQSVGDESSWKSGWAAWLPALMMVVVVMLVCSAVYAFFQRPKPTVAANAHTRTNTPAVAPPAVQQPAASTQPPAQPAQPAAETPTANGAPQQPESAAATAAVPPAAPPAQTAPVTPATPGPVHVIITAAEPAWVRAMTDGKFAFSGVIDANQTRTLDANQTVLLRLGNAGGVSIELNGKPIGAVGPKGQVRNVQLTSGGFQIVEASKSPAPVDPL